MRKSVLVVAAHPDDEVLGCGATMAKHARDGDTVSVLIMAEGITSRDISRDPQKRKLELQELSVAAKAANRILGVKNLALHDFPDNRMDSVNLLDLVKLVEEQIQKHKPTVVYTHYGWDVNVDHQLTHDAVLTACRPMPGQPVKTLLFFEVASSTEWRPASSAPPFAPNWFTDISKTLPAKLKALKSYSREMRPWPHARSIKALEHLARWRGATIGVEAAEAFVLGRELDA